MGKLILIRWRTMAKTLHWFFTFTGTSQS